MIDPFDPRLVGQPISDLLTGVCPKCHRPAPEGSEHAYDCFAPPDGISWETWDAMVEAGAQAIAKGRDFWDDLDEWTRKLYRDDARACLRAALPSVTEESRRLRQALTLIREQCGDDGPPEINAVQVAREALAPR